MEIIFLIGRILVAGFYIMNGFNHLTQSGGMAGYAGAKGVPSPQLAVIGSGVILILGGLSILLGLWPWLGVILILIFLVPVSLMMHNFWAMEDPQQRQSEMIQFMKNMALIGSALMYLGIPTPWPFSLNF